MLAHDGSLNDFVTFVRVVSVDDRVANDPPEHLPPLIDAIFREGNKCLSVQCWNAAAAMYRLALDIVTKELLPTDTSVEPNSRVRRSLGLRMGWLFANSSLPKDLQNLADCIREDGNDGAHDASLSEQDANDLSDFIFELLRRIFTEPEKLKLAEDRRAARRAPQ